MRTGFVLTLPLFVGAVPLAVAAPATPEEQLVASVKNGPLQKLGPWLANLYEEFQRSTAKKAFKTRNPVLKVYGGRVGVDLYADDPASLQRSLATLGAVNIKASGPLVSAQVPVAALGELAALPSLKFADPVLARVRAARKAAW